MCRAPACHSSLLKKNLSMAKNMVRRLSVACAAALVAWPLAIGAESASVLEIGKFSSAHAGGALPDGWQPWILSKRKKLTAYELVSDGDTVVVKAVANDSASGLIRHIRIDPKEYPIIRWRWKAANLIRSADNSSRSKEDSPVRIYIGFEGDIATLSLGERLFFKVVKAGSGQEMPFATLNYIWENDAPVGSVIANPNTTRIQMIVVESGGAKTGQWISYERNLYEDYKRAYGQEPPAIMGLFLMTDTDNTGESATGYYGDIELKKAAK
jgi:hypothetical protein